MRESGTADSRRVYALGSRSRDLAAFGLVLVFLLGTSFTLRVYYRITVYEIELVRVAPDGSRTLLETPESIHALQLWHLPPESVLAHLEEHFSDLAAGNRWRVDLLTGHRLEWTVRYSFNSAAMDRRRVLLYSEQDLGPN